MLQSQHVVLFRVVASLGGLKASHGAVVIHPTAYDGCVELAAMQLNYVACGSSLVDSNYKCAREMVKSHLLQAFETCSQLSLAVACGFFSRPILSGIGSLSLKGLEVGTAPDGQGDPCIQEAAVC